MDEELVEALEERHSVSDDARRTFRADLATLTWFGQSLRQAYGLSPEELAELINSPPAEELARTRPMVQAKEAAEAPGATSFGRYEFLGQIGMGGMGEVLRVRDPALNRTVAMKVLPRGMQDQGSMSARFREEAEVTAGLQHPGIVPVHERGVLEDGRPYYVMKEVQGETLADAVARYHGTSASDEANAERTSTFRGLVDAFRRVCEAVAYAHAQGVVHRDLKPANVMLGAFGEVLVLDWGLAKAGWTRDSLSASRGRMSGKATPSGTVIGTAAYMPPEQAWGRLPEVGPRSDVYSLGAVLYEILSGGPPFVGSMSQVLEQVRKGSPPPVDHPDEVLSAICTRALSYTPDNRHTDAGVLAGQVRDWLDGAHRREKALEVVAVADVKLSEAEALRDRAQEMRAEAESQLEGVEPWQSEEVKAPGWSKQDEAARLERDADMKEIEHRETLRSALNYAPDMPEAHERLARLNRRHHEAAEERRDEAGAEQWEALMRHHDRSDRHAAYLKGDGALTLVTDPAGAEVLLFRYETRNRRLVAVFERALGTTPLAKVSLAMGSYLCLIRAEGRAEVRYPVSIGRQEHWKGVRPGDTEPFAIALPRREELDRQDCYVPAGWYLAGGDQEAYQSIARQRLWLDGMVFKTWQVTNREYIAFLDDLVAQGREEDALRHAPRERGGTEGEQGAVIYGREADGRFGVRPDAEGDMWLLDWPVMMVDWRCARAYAAWRAASTGVQWRLPGELEWEKAARGTDGRFYPWGDWLDPSWCSMVSSHTGGPMPAVVDSYPEDESPYGVRGLGGNMRDWTENVFLLGGPPSFGHRLVDDLEAGRATDDGATRVTRGGSWRSDTRIARAAARFGFTASSRTGDLGFRLCRSLL